MPELIDVISGGAVGGFAVHLGANLPIGPPTLANLVDASFAGYSPSPLGLPQQALQASGFGLLSGTASFRCLDPSGFAAPCCWLTYGLGADTVLVAYAAVDPNAIGLPSSGTLEIDLDFSVFAIPPAE